MIVGLRKRFETLLEEEMADYVSKSDHDQDHD